MKNAEPDPSKLDEDSLREAALSYLDRYDASVAQLRRVLLRRVAKYGKPDGEEAALERVERVLERFQSSALIDDERFARGFAQAARQRGSSSQKIREKLRARGLDDGLVQTVLGQIGDNDGLDDLTAAIAYAKKRRLASRYDLQVPADKQRALASLARQGFSFAVAERALESA